MDQGTTLEALQLRYFQSLNRHHLLCSTELCLINRSQTRLVPYAERHKIPVSYRELDDRLYRTSFSDL